MIDRELYRPLCWTDDAERLAGDEVYGADPALRAERELARTGYVLPG